MHPHQLPVDPGVSPGSISPSSQHDAAPAARRRTGLTNEARKPPTSTGLSADEQYLRDLEVLDRIEQQLGMQDPCFFCAMGEIAREQRHG